MADFLLSQVAIMLVQSTIPPMLAEGRMQQILVHRRELADQHLIQNIEDSLFRFHPCPHDHADLALR